MRDPESLEAMTAVYTYCFPEVRPFLRRCESLDPSLYKISATAAEASAAIAPLGLSPALDIPVTKRGWADLDELHVPVLERMVKAYSSHVQGLTSFENRYPLSGSSPGIFHLLAELKASGTERIYTLAGEYEGYGAYARAVGIENHVVDLDEMALDTLAPGVWFCSNPSARDGRWLPEGFIDQLCELGHRVVLDLAYVGLTAPHRLDVSNPQVIAVLVSLSKPYGVFRHRIGFLVTRYELPSLYATKWFKDVGRLLLGLSLVEAFPPGTLHSLHQHTQARIVDSLNYRHGLDLQPAPVLLLATTSSPDPDLHPFRRSDGYRLCLTPYFEAMEGQP